MAGTTDETMTNNLDARSKRADFNNDKEGGNTNQLICTLLNTTRYLNNQPTMNTKFTMTSRGMHQ